MRTLQITAGPLAGRELKLDGELVIGRENADVTIEDEELSRRHAAIRPVDGGIEVEDLGSLNGTFVDGRKLDGTTTITGRGTIKLGTTQITAEVDLPQTTKAAPIPGGDQPTRARDIPASDATVARDIPAPAPDATVARAVPPSAQPTAARATTPPPPPPPAAPPGAQPAGAPAGGPPQGSAKRESPQLPLGASIGIFVAVMVALLAILLLVDNGDDESSSSSSSSNGNRFSLMAQGYSIETFDNPTKQRQLDIYMRTVGAPHGINRLTLDKYLDESGPPPQRTYDAIYTFTSRDGDSVSLAAEGDVTEPEGPDAVLGQTYEKWTVVNGTGKFAKARGTGTITTAVAVAARGPASAPTGSNVVKYIEGEMDLDGGSDLPGPPAASRDAIGGYKFGDPAEAEAAVGARRASGRYINEPNALKDGFTPQPSADAPVCSDPAGNGSGGAIEYVNAKNLADGKLDPAKPDALLYVPAEGAIRRLAGVQYRVEKGGQPGTVLGQQVSADKPLNAWLFLYNPRGLFVAANPVAQCPAGPAKDTAKLVPSAGGPPPGASGDGPPPGAGGPPPGATGDGPPPGQGE